MRVAMLGLCLTRVVGEPVVEFWPTAIEVFSIVPGRVQRLDPEVAASRAAPSTRQPPKAVLLCEFTVSQALWRQ